MPTLIVESERGCCWSCWTMSEEETHHQRPYVGSVRQHQRRPISNINSNAKGKRSRVNDDDGSYHKAVSSSKSKRHQTRNVHNEEGSVSSNNTNGSSIGSSSMTPTMMWLNEKETEAETARRNNELARLVKYELFAHVKFISHSMQLQYSTAANSICQWMLKKMHIDKTHEATWWERYKNDIPNHLSTRRNNINTNMKRIFQGKGNLMTKCIAK